MKIRKTVSIALASGILLGSVSGNAMSDIGNSWAKPYIERLANKGIITGYTDGTFKPDKNITREEASKIISEYIGNSEASGNGNLSDIENRWSTKFIKHLVSKGIVTGYTDGTFKPEKNITRAEFATIVCRYLESEGLVDGVDTSEVNLWDIESNWAKEYIKKMAAKGYINGYPNGSFKPNNLITRAEVSAIVALMDGAEKPEKPESNLEYNQKVVNSLTELPEGQSVIFENKADGIRIRTDANNNRTLADFGVKSPFVVQKWEYSHDTSNYTSVKLPNRDDFINTNGDSRIYKSKVLSHDEMNYACNIWGEEYYIPETLWTSEAGYREHIMRVSTAQLDPAMRLRDQTVKVGDIVNIEVAFVDKVTGQENKWYVDTYVHEVNKTAYMPSTVVKHEKPE